MNRHIYSCKCHDRPYTVCPNCQHQYCSEYWSGCPSCATSTLVAYAGRQTPGPWYVSRLDIGRGVIRWVVYRGQQNMGEYLTASAACEALLLWTDSVFPSLPGYDVRAEAEGFVYSQSLFNARTCDEPFYHPEKPHIEE